MILTNLVLSAILPWLTFQAPQSSDVLRLKDGTVLVGEVISPDEDGFTLRRADTGGEFRVEWKAMNPIDARRLRQEFGFENLASQQAMVEAWNLVLADGSTILCHHFKEQGAQLLYYIRDEAGIPIAKHRVYKRIKVEVPANEVLTREQIYGAKLEELTSGGRDEDPKAHLALARYLELLLDYENAQKHYDKARELDPEYAKREIEGALRRLPAKMLLRDQDLMLQDIATAQRRQHFDEGFALCEQFVETYPNSPKRSLVEGRRTLLESIREDAARSHVTRLWQGAMEELCETAAKENKGALDAAQEYALGQLGEDIRKLVAEELAKKEGGKFWSAVTSEDVARLFRDRLTKPTPTKRKRKASYGDGTIVLGKGGAVKGIEAIEERLARAKAEEERRAAAERERARQQRQNQRGGRGGRSGNRGNQGNQQIDMSKLPQPPTPEEWWKKSSRSEKEKFMIASYVERGRDWEVLGFDYRVCDTCRGVGKETHESVPMRRQDGSTTYGSIQITCRECAGSGIERVVLYW